MTQKRRAVTKYLKTEKNAVRAQRFCCRFFYRFAYRGFVCLYLLVFMVSYVNGDSKINLEEYKENQDQTTIIYAYDTNNEVTELSRYGEQNRVWVTYGENRMKALYRKILRMRILHLRISVLRSRRCRLVQNIIVGG